MITPGVYRRINSELLVYLDDKGKPIMALLMQEHRNGALMFGPGSSQFFDHGFEIERATVEAKYGTVMLAGYEYCLQSPLTSFLIDEARRIRNDQH